DPRCRPSAFGGRHLRVRSPRGSIRERHCVPALYCYLSCFSPFVTLGRWSDPNLPGSPAAQGQDRKHPLRRSAFAERNVPVSNAALEIPGADGISWQTSADVVNFLAG